MLNHGENLSHVNLAGKLEPVLRGSISCAGRSFTNWLQNTSLQLRQSYVEKCSLDLLKAHMHSVKHLKSEEMLSASFLGPKSR